jgi:hypothetical protein
MGFFTAACWDDVAKDQLALAPRVAGIHQAGDILALHQPGEQLEPIFGTVDGLQVEAGRYHGQVCERPLAALHLVLLRGRDLEQMPYRRGEHIVFSLVVVAVPRETAQRPSDVVGD